MINKELSIPPIRLRSKYKYDIWNNFPSSDGMEPEEKHINNKVDI